MSNTLELPCCDLEQKKSRETNATFWHCVCYPWKLILTRESTLGNSFEQRIYTSQQYFTLYQKQNCLLTWQPHNNYNKAVARNFEPNLLMKSTQ